MLERREGFLTGIQNSVNKQNFDSYSKLGYSQQIMSHRANATSDTHHKPIHNIIVYILQTCLYSHLARSLLTDQRETFYNQVHSAQACEKTVVW